MGIKKKRRAMKAVLKEGLEAALRADADVLENCKPKTVMGRLVRGMVLEAAKCKATPLKTVMSLLDREADEGAEDQEIFDEPRWDWSPDGVWETMPEAEPERGEAREEVEGPAKKELRRRINRLIEAGDHERVAAIMEAARSGNYGEPNGAVPP
jgi:hypothetical protein